MRNVSAISRIFSGNPAAATISRERRKPARVRTAAIRHPKSRDCLATSSARRKSPPPMARETMATVPMLIALAMMMTKK